MQASGELDALIAEHAALSSSYDKHATVGYTMVPVALTAIGGVAVFRQTLSPWAGLTASLLLVLLISWEGISHRMLNSVGVRLIQVEDRIEQVLGARGADYPMYFTSFIGQTTPGLYEYWVLIAMVGLVILVVSMGQWWFAMNELGWTPAGRAAGIAFPLALITAGLWNLYHVQRMVEAEAATLTEARSKSGRGELEPAESSAY